MEQQATTSATTKQSLKEIFETMEPGERHYLDPSLTRASLSSEATRWNVYTKRHYRVMKDRENMYFVQREA